MDCILYLIVSGFLALALAYCVYAIRKQATYIKMLEKNDLDHITKNKIMSENIERLRYENNKISKDNNELNLKLEEVTQSNDHLHRQLLMIIDVTNGIEF